MTKRARPAKLRTARTMSVIEGFMSCPFRVDVDCVLLGCSIYPDCQMSSINISIGYSIVIASDYGTESNIIEIAY